MITWYIVVEDESGNKVELRDVPKDVEVVLMNLYMTWRVTNV